MLRLFSLLVVVVALVPGRVHAQTHEANYALIKSHWETPWPRFSIIAKRDVDKQLRAGRLATPGVSYGCYRRLTRASEGTLLGLEDIDLLLMVDGERIANEEEGQKWLASLKAGDTHELTVRKPIERRRGGRKFVEWETEKISMTVPSWGETVTKLVPAKRDPISGAMRIEPGLALGPMGLLCVRTPQGKWRLLKRLTYAGSDWVFAEKFTIAIGEERFHFTENYFDISRDVVRGGVVEQATLDITDEPELLAALMSDEEDPQLVRFTGSEVYADRDLSDSRGLARLVIASYYMRCRNGEESKK